MPRKFRLTCARTTYFEVELAAESIAEAEHLFESTLASDPKLCDRSARLGPSTHRIVEAAETTAEQMAVEEPADAAA
jgi:hypothetical protein